jgi:hypothetical protein
MLLLLPLRTTGSFVGLLKKLDDSLEEEGEGDKAVFFKTGIAAYGIGLLITFAANLLSARCVSCPCVATGCGPDMLGTPSRAHYAIIRRLSPLHSNFTS